MPRRAAAYLRAGGFTDTPTAGVDGIPTARLAAPPLTTVAFDLREKGRRRAQMIMASLAGRRSP
jgi:DNA-binding LacI/PurR family transcriptional regulator